MNPSKEVSPGVNLTDSPTQSRLNVIFHGPFLFIYYPSRVEVVTPQTAEHVVVAGTWLGEKQCTYGTYFLTGIKTQQDPFDPTSMVKPDGHLVINAQAVSINIEQGPYYRFILPLPSLEYAFATAQIDPTKLLVGGYAKYIKATTFGTVHVLSYKVGDKVGEPDTPQLEDLAWVPQPNPYKRMVNCVPTTSYRFATNLHVYAEAAFAPDPNHPFRDFQQMVAMLPGLKLGLAPTFHDLSFGDPQNRDDLGIIREEQGGLRGLPPYIPPFTPPLVCDAPSLVVVGAQDSGA